MQGRLGKCSVVLPEGKGKQFGGKVSGDLSEDWKKLLTQQRKIRNKRKWHHLKGKGTKQEVCSFYFSLFTWRTWTTTSKPPLGARQCRYDAPTGRWLKSFGQSWILTTAVHSVSVVFTDVLFSFFYVEIYSHNLMIKKNAPYFRKPQEYVVYVCVRAHIHTCWWG